MTTVEEKANALDFPITSDFMKKELRKGLVNITFIKKDGSIRKMKATLDSKLIPEDHMPKGTGTLTESEINGDNVRVYDVEVEGWRTVIVDKVVSFYA